jgi:hypothetical protein
MRVSTVRFHSTHLKTLSTSPTRGPPATAGTDYGRGHRLVLTKSTGLTGPTSAHNGYILVRYSGTQKNDIYKK